MREFIFAFILLFSQISINQEKENTFGFLVEDTTFVLAKEHCRNSPVVCSVDDYVYISRMLFYNGNDFWKSYKTGLFYFTGLEVRNYQERKGIKYDYIEEVELLLHQDDLNDSNLVLIRNPVKKGLVKNVDSFYYKLYKVTCNYAYVRKNVEFMPNFFARNSKYSYKQDSSNVYFITRITNITPFNEVPLKSRVITIGKHTSV